MPVKRPCVTCGAMVPEGRQRAPYTDHQQWCGLVVVLRKLDASCERRRAGVACLPCEAVEDTYEASRLATAMCSCGSAGDPRGRQNGLLH